MTVMNWAKDELQIYYAMSWLMWSDRWKMSVAHKMAIYKYNTLMITTDLQEYAENYQKLF